MESFRSVKERYKALFQSDAQVEEGESDGFVEHWGWDLIFHKLSGEDRTKWPFLYAMKSTEFLDHWAMIEEIQRKQEAELKAQTK